MNKLFLFGVVFGFVNLVLAASGHGEAGHVEIPTAVYYQAFNLTLVIAGIIYFSRQPIAQFFRTRRAEYLALAEKSKKLKDDAEAKLRDIEHRLAVLESTKQQSLLKAEADAQKLKEQMIKDAEATAERIRKDSAEAVKAEVQRAKTALMLQMTEEALRGAQQILSKDISGADQGRLQENLVQQL